MSKDHKKRERERAKYRFMLSFRQRRDSFAQFLRLGTERNHKGVCKIIPLAEAFDGILIGFSEYPHLDEVKHHIANVLGRTHTPVSEHRDRHRSEFLQAMDSESIKQLGRHYVGRSLLAGLFSALKRRFQRIAQKYVCLRVIAGILLDHLVEGLLESVVCILPPNLNARLQGSQRSGFAPVLHAETGAERQQHEQPQAIAPGGLEKTSC